MKQISSLLGLMFFQLVASAQQAYSGFVHDANTGEALIGVVVFTADKKLGTSTDAYGHFNIHTNPAQEVCFQYLGYQNQCVVLASNTTQLKINLQPISQELKQAEVKADKIQTNKIGAHTIDLKLLNQLPALGGERDLIKAFQLMPGVKKGADGTATMLVRGGAQDQNLVLLDDAPVYNPTHMLGFFSLFNTDAVKEATLQTGGFTANYGGRLSSVMDVYTMDGNTKKVETSASIGLLASRISFNGPMANGRGTFLVAGRISYINKLYEAIGKNLPAYFYDFNAKFSYNLTDKDKLFFNFYNGKDILKENQNDTTNNLALNTKMGNQIASLRWNRAFNNKRIFSNLVIFNSRYYYDIFAELNKSTLSINSRIADVGLKYTINHSLTSNLVLKYGTEITKHKFIPTTTTLTGSFSDAITPQAEQTNVMAEGAVFLSTDYQFNQKLKTTIGARYSYAFTNQTNYQNIEPRVLVSYQLKPNMQVSLSYAKMVQYMFLISSSSTFLPTDLWYGISPNIKPQQANVFAAGYTMQQKNYTTKIEAYFKPMQNLVEYKEGTTDFVNADMDNSLVQGKGNAYGLEWFNTYTNGKVNVVFAYTLSWSNRTFAELNQGKQFLARFDRRHDLNLAITYNFTNRICLAGVWSYATGSRFTPVSGYFMMPAGNFNSIELLPIYTGRNAVQLAAAHKLDVNLIIKNNPNKKIRAEWHIGAYNVYNQTQPFRIKTFNNPDGTLTYKQVGLFGFIPAASYQIKF